MTNHQHVCSIERLPLSIIYKSSWNL